jgi:signal transduction histidine kinase
MPDEYLKEIDNFVIGEDSLACGLAVPTGKSVLTADVYEEPLWKPWTGLAKKYKFRGCWSFPVKTFEHKAVGTFAMYFDEAHEATPDELALAEIVTQTAAVIIARVQAEEALRKSEEQLKRFNVSLEKEVEKNKGELKESRDNLFAKNQQLNQTISQLESFNFLASHDLREPLRKIQTYANQLINQKPGDPKLNLYLDRINESSIRMTQLIDDLLEYSRLSRTTEAYQEVDLNKTVKNVRKDYEIMIKEKHATIDSEHLPVINAVPFQIHQLFANLVSNSLKFNNGKPHVKISARTVSGTQVITGNGEIPEGRFTELTFTDNGIGLDNQFNKQIFEVFQRLHNKSEYSGTGVGLSIVERVVKNHNGYIHAHGEVKRGATIKVWLPL